jgi:tRNA(Ile)-lysidine synthase
LIIKAESVSRKNCNFACRIDFRSKFTKLIRRLQIFYHQNALMSVANVSTFEQIQKFLIDNQLEWLLHDLRGRSVGVALSGGADSVALLLVAIRMGWQPVALHCNFQLRGTESSRDEQFVRSLCNRLGVELLVTKFDVVARMAETGESTEMACRSLRYDWFARMAAERNLAAVALGHHRDDNVETFMMNAMRGCGLAGVKGIPVSRDIYVRPLLALTRQQILQFLEQEGKGFVTDSTNNETVYQRNKLRNVLLPEMEQLFPGALGRLADTVGMLNADYQLFRSLIAEKAALYVADDGTVDLAALLRDEPQPLTLLFHLLDGQIDMERLRVMVAQADSSGKRYQTASGREYLLDRGRLIPVADAPAASPKPSITQRLIPREEFRPMRNPEFAWFDADLLPPMSELTLRHPQVGDAILPFGMTGRQLLSDLFRDNKLSAIDKQHCWVLAHGDEILWVPGLRNSRLYSVTGSTTNIMELHVAGFAKK